MNFADGETSIEILDQIRGKHIFIILSTCKPVNENLIELIFTVAAAKRAGAASVTSVIPYFGYSR